MDEPKRLGYYNLFSDLVDTKTLARRYGCPMVAAMYETVINAIAVIAMQNRRFNHRDPGAYSRGSSLTLMKMAEEVLQDKGFTEEVFENPDRTVNRVDHEIDYDKVIQFLNMLLVEQSRKEGRM